MPLPFNVGVAVVVDEGGPLGTVADVAGEDFGEVHRVDNRLELCCHQFYAALSHAITLEFDLGGDDKGGKCDLGGEPCICITSP